MIDLLKAILGFPVTPRRHNSGGLDSRFLEKHDWMSQQCVDREFMTNHDCGANVAHETWKIHSHLDKDQSIWMYGFIASGSGPAKFGLTIAGGRIGTWFTSSANLNLDVKFDRPIFVRPNYQISLTKLNQAGCSQDLYSTLFYGDKAYPDFDELDNKHEQAD